MKRLIALVCGLGAALPALAAGTLADVRIHDRVSGRTLAVHESGGRHFVAGTPGHEYEIRIRNRSGGDLLAVVAVDGVNVVSGETAAARQSGYVIAPGDTLSLRGWRKSLEQVAAFQFTNLHDSYAARTGRPDNVGVIGVAVFRRKPEPAAELQAPPAEKRADAGYHAQRHAPQAAQAPIGTGHGRRVASAARYVEFERDSDVPAETVTIHYDTHANLVARGIIPEERRWPEPFPGGFVPDPPGRG